MTTSGHRWAAGLDDGACDAAGRAVVRPHIVVGHGPAAIVEALPAREATVASCARCGLVAAEWPETDPTTQTWRMVRAAGVALDALAVMRAPPPCVPDLLSRDGATTTEETR